MKILEYFPIKTDETRKVNENLYEVKSIENTFIINDKNCLKIACYPSIVGKELKIYAKNSAKLFLKFCKKFGLIKNQIVITNILRASLGYEINSILKSKKEIFIRPKYQKFSFRNHTFRKIKVIYKETSQIEKLNKFSLIVADTIATGRSMIESLRSIKEYFDKIERIIFYGFISEYGLKKVKDFCIKNDLECYFFAISNLTALAYNKYDMVLYGIDESFYSKFKRKKYLTSICDFETLKRFYNHYIPGLDQPGDFSARQETLFDGKKFLDNKKDIVKHLKNNIKIIGKIYEISKNEPWFEKIHEKRIKKEVINLKNKINFYESKIGK